MELLLIGLFFVFGLICGTIFYEYGIRIPIDTFKHEGSWHCPTCKERLKWVELIRPMFLLFAGKCPKCQKKFPFLYPCIQLLTGFSFAMSYYRFSFDTFLIFSLTAVSLAVIILVSDIRYQVVPNAVLILFLPVFIGRVILFPIPLFWNHIVGLLLAFTLSLLILLLSKGRMRFGDWKYFTLLGFAFGWEAFLVLLVLSIIYAVTGDVILTVTHKEELKARIRLGPYISLAALTTLFFGREILEMIITLF